MTSLDTERLKILRLLGNISHLSGREQLQILFYILLFLQQLLETTQKDSHRVTPLYCNSIHSCLTFAVSHSGCSVFVSYKRAWAGIGTSRATWQEDRWSGPTHQHLPGPHYAAHIWAQRIRGGIAHSCVKQQALRRIATAKHKHGTSAETTGAPASSAALKRGNVSDTATLRGHKATTPQTKHNHMAQITATTEEKSWNVTGCDLWIGATGKEKKTETKLKKTQSNNEKYLKYEHHFSKWQKIETHYYLVINHRISQPNWTPDTLLKIQEKNK